MSDQELYIDPNWPEWKKKHMMEQERRRKAALEGATQPSGPTAEQIAAQRQAEEAEKQRLIELQEQERKRRAQEELQKLKREAESRKSAFAPSTADLAKQALTDLEETKPKVARSVSGPRTNSSIISPRQDNKSAGDVPAWKKKQLEEEAKKAQQLEEERKKKEEALREILQQGTQ
eukprot:TRINITY_DN815_c0_g1_i1.p1 TRINITY_DN815_c0_g1~~TRINITY_DN815_c0_g1_i1.p1  ORF type:complete len:176 (+),score=71.58 TRINITY_DN815_c0_g1_i1:583-1110(+)